MSATTSRLLIAEHANGVSNTHACTDDNSASNGTIISKAAQWRNLDGAYKRTAINHQYYAAALTIIEMHGHMPLPLNSTLMLKNEFFTE